MIKLIAIDMDGTLLDSKKQVPEENIKALRQAADQDVKIVICTGRPKSGVVPIFEQLGLETKEEYAILDNGCTIYKANDWSLLAYESLSSGDIDCLAESAETYPEISVTYFDSDHYYILGEEVPDLVSYDAGLVFTTPTPTTLEHLKNSSVPIFQGMFMGDASALDRFQAEQEERLSQVFSTVRSQSCIYEAMPKGTTKASALAKLTEKLGLESKEIMAIGDAANDIEMLQFAGISVAMGNAGEAVKAICNHVTTSHDEAGVARAIEQLVLKK
ncbi:Cof-type HAD-IIB family hydrolase [Streptococcus merionis]|uniref:Haloacid dehalogenase-like hydrolase n=1 Tax=Streptococcus merionis TaxID=400065 RepID=A0A239SWS6_9STRE|nr:Cof-type HAD-IIB family hydrolase [Streptococcus merionis]SNU89887.1 haloacid dehalogenase-like hydrolase [Streptococcus merionis]